MFETPSVLRESFAFPEASGNEAFYDLRGLRGPADLGRILHLAQGQKIKKALIVYNFSAFQDDSRVC